MRNNGVVYYESRKRELKIRLMNEGRCDERLKARVVSWVRFFFWFFFMFSFFVRLCVLNDTVEKEL